MKSLFFLTLAFAAGSLADDKDNWPRIEIETPWQPKDVNLKLKVVCETSDASPLWHQILSAADKIDKRPMAEMACSTGNVVGSKCTGLESFEGARISLCSGTSDSLDCRLVSGLARGIVDKCADGGDRAGGWGEWELQDSDGSWGQGWSTVSIERLF